MAHAPILDRQLVDAVLAGDGDAYRVLVERASDTVLGICRRIVRDPDEAEDVAQDAFIQAYRSLAAWRGDGPFEAWVRRIAMRRAFAHVGARRDVGLPEVDGEALDLRGRPGDEPEPMALARETRDELVTMISALPAAHRRVVALRFSDELSIEEIARATSAPSGTVKSRLHRALGELRERMDARPIT
jgi:RNA polymerase sigma-70 factor, ECF subfamily